jgi:hypothetical protein
VRFVIALVVPLVATQGCITVAAKTWIAPRHVSVPPARLEVIEERGGSSYHVLARYADGATARWRIASCESPTELPGRVPLPPGEALPVTSLDVPREGQRVLVQSGPPRSTRIAVKTHEGRVLTSIDVDAHRLPPWWRAALWTVSLPFTIALDLVSWPVTVPWYLHRWGKYPP